MASKRWKTLRKMRNSQTNWKQKDVIKLYRAFGFSIDYGRRHVVVSHPDFKHERNLRTVVPRNREILVVYVKDAVRLIDLYCELAGIQEGD